MSECAACDAMGRDEQGRSRLCERHCATGKRWIRLIRAQNAFLQKPTPVREMKGETLTDAPEQGEAHGDHTG